MEKFPGSSSNASWGKCIEKDGDIHPQYIELLVMAYLFKMANDSIVQVGAAADLRPSPCQNLSPALIRLCAEKAMR